MADMSDRPSPERPAEALWVVDVTAPLPPGRVRLVAAEAAARLNLPAEKLVALLENRIGPVTKPLPKASADRVAEVLDLAGADVAIRTARPGEGQPSRPTERPAPPPSSPPVASDVEADEVELDRAEPETAEPEGAEAERPEPARSEPEPAAAEPVAARPFDAEEDERATVERAPGASDGATTARAEAEAVASDAARADADPTDDVEPVVDRDDAAARAVEGDLQDEDEEAPGPPARAQVDFDEIEVPVQEPASDLPPPRAEAPPERPRGPRPDPWDRLANGDEGDEAMLGAWRRRAPRPPLAGAGGPDAWDDDDEDRDALDVGAASPRAAATERDRASTGATAPRPEEAAVPRGDAWHDASGEPEEPLGEVLRTGSGRGRTSGVTVTGSRYVAGRNPPTTVSRSWQDDEDEQPFAYGMRDPFAEAERRERTVRRWVLVIALVVSAAVFLALQWAYSRPGLDDRTPPPYAEGLSAYRSGAFVSAARAWTPRAEAGDRDAMYMLGWMAEFGQGRPWSNREAVGWYRQAAERGHAPSQARLADLYARGLGVDLDPDEALRWYLAAAEGGVPRAQREAARSLAAAGQLSSALGWLERAALHDPEAAAWLALVTGGEGLK